MEDFQSVYKKLKLGVKKNDASAENVDRARKDGLKKRAPIRRLPEVTVKSNKKARKQSEKINEMDTSAGIQIFAPTNKEEKVDKENVEESTVKDVADQANEKKVCLS
ncbi:hypothetical protein Ddc_12831 [Ditylenchus destructor]|nr:hypothetical protein Ddc_12831 [Ditylenchus destructor]